MTAKPNIKTIVITLLLPCAALAGDWRDPNAKFSTKSNRAETLVISWMVVPNSKVQATCEAVSKDIGLGGFGFALDACSFWQKKTCLIITGEQTTRADLGHETQHCFQGNFH